MKPIRYMSLVAIGAAAAVGFSGGAVAQAPVAEGCNGLHIKDPAGDQTVGPILGDHALNGGPGQTKGPDNLDITGIFFEHTNGVTTANMRIANLTKDIPAEIRTGALSYAIEFNKTEDGVLFARAELKGGAWSFMYAVGERVENPANTTERPLEEVETKGQAIEGPNGLISIELPPSITLGTKLVNVFGIVSQRSDETQYVGYGNDEAPDGGVNEGKDYTVKACEAPAPAEAPAVEVPAAAPPAAPPASSPSTAPAPAAKAPAKKSKRAACQKKAKKIKNKRKRAKALKKCRKMKG